jgi:hypothetical protein
VCGAEKKQTNHWFVAYDQAGELRVCGFNPRTRIRVGAKHLCGQACLHKMIDEFISFTLSGRLPSTSNEASESPEAPLATDASLTLRAANQAPAFSRNPLSPPASAMPQRAIAAIPAAVLAMQPRLLPEQPRAATVQSSIDATPNYASRRWRAEAWERERERELRTATTPRR